MNVTPIASQPLRMPPSATAATTTAPRPHGSIRSMILQTVVDVHNSGRAASRPVLVSLTGLSYSVVDDHVKRLVDDGRLRRVVNGVFEPVEQLPPARAVSFTKLPSGMAKLEIGDTCIDINPSEERAIGRMLSGSAAEQTGIQNARELADALSRLSSELEEERSRRRRLEETILRLQRRADRTATDAVPSTQVPCEIQ